MGKNNIEQGREEMTKMFVAFHNSWKGAAWKDALQERYDKWMGDDNQILSTVKLQDNATDVLLNNPNVNRLFSAVIDAYDDLPYRPDTSFEFCWRAFEILASMYIGSKKPMRRTSEICEQMCAHFDTGSKTEAVIQELNKHCSFAGIRFMLQRLVDTHKSSGGEKDSLIINEQYGNVVERVKPALGEPFYSDFCKKYYKQVNGVNVDIDASSNHKAAQVIFKYLVKGAEFDLIKNVPEGLTLSNQKYRFSTAKVMELIIGGILYTSRCYRIHGDYFSPFKSNLSELTQYYEYYYFLIYTYAMFWYLLYCYMDDNRIEKFFTLDAVNECVERCLANLSKLPNTKDDLERMTREKGINI